MAEDGDQQYEIFEFPIRETNGETKMKNINPSSLPHFHGLISEDPNTFLFEFEVVCRTYDYASDDKNLKLFSLYIEGINLEMVHEFRRK
jgi:hypothetical protein